MSLALSESVSCARARAICHTHTHTHPPTHTQKRTHNAHTHTQTLDGPVPSVTACIRPRDVEGLVSEVDRYAVWSHEQQALRILDRDQVWALDLAPKESDVLTVAALTRLPEVVDSEGREAVWAPVGLSAMLNAGGAILSVRTVRGGVRQINQLLKKIAPNMPSGGGGAGMVTSLGLELLEELRALLIMLADAEEAGGGDVSKYMAGELRDFDFGALQKLVDNMLKMPALSRETESTLQVRPQPKPLNCES